MYMHSYIYIRIIYSHIDTFVYIDSCMYARFAPIIFSLVPPRQQKLLDIERHLHMYVFLT